MKAELARASVRRQGGFMLVAVMVLVTVLLAGGIAFMRWSVDESLQSAESVAAMQAYYLGQMGIVEKGFAWLQSLPASQLPIGETVLEGKQVPGYGRYEQVSVLYLPSTAGGDFWAQKQIFRISAVGVVRIPFFDRGQSSYKNVKRKAVLYVEVRNFADYMYLSHRERTRFGDWIKFWHGDVLNGRVHSNDTIAIMEDPIFYDQVTSKACVFWQGPGYNPQFLGPPPVLCAKAVAIPEVAERLRAGAAQRGHFYGEAGTTYYARFDGPTCTMWRWPSGTPMDSTDRWSVYLTDSTCIFVDAPLWMHGTVQGRVTIGSSQIVRLMDDIRYVDADPRTGYTDSSSTNIMGIVSERDVKVANTWANGRENSNGRGRNQPHPDSTDIVITAAIVALGESFTFENQNDPDSGYVCDCIPDDRGQIWLFGSVTQMRRGYVHRSNNQSTGYLKQYRYDNRLRTRRPPCFFNVTDEEGHALFNVVQWGQGMESPEEVARWNIVRYN